MREPRIRFVPPTEDPDVIKPFLEGLDPRVMPRDGESARGAALLGRHNPWPPRRRQGRSSFCSTGITDADLSAFNTHAAEGGAPVLFWLAGRDPGAADKLKQIAGANCCRVDGGPQ